MNERIKELAEQADLLGDFTPTKIPGRYVGYITEEQILKFAELIVRQMSDITDAHTEVFQTDRDRALIEHIKQSVKQHFGVEE
jgi:hypothetical protein